MHRLILISFLIVSPLMVNEANSQIHNPTGNVTSITSDDIWPKTLSGSHYNEFWNYHFYLNDDITLHITFSVANFGNLKSPVSGVQASVHNLDGKLYQLSREYDIEHLVQDSERYMFRNRMEREIFFEGKLPDQHRVRIYTTKDGITYDIDITLSDILSGFKWGDGKFNIGSEKVGIITHIPYARARGYIKINEINKSVRGTAYMDHTFQNQTTTRLMDSGFRFVHHTDSRNWDLFYFMLPDNSKDLKTIGYRVQNVNGRMKLQGIQRIKQVEKNTIFGERVAHIVDLEFSDGQTAKIMRVADHERFSVLSELSRIARSIARRFLGGEVIHFRGETVLMEPGERVKNGYYNFFIIR